VTALLAPPTRPRRGRRTTTAGDLAVVGLAASVGGVMAYFGASAGGHPQPWLLSVVAVAEAAPLVWRRRAPVAVLVTTVTVFMLGAVATDAAPAPMFGSLIAAYTVGSSTSRRTAAISALAAGLVPPLITAGWLGAPFPWTISVTGQEPHLLDAVLGSVFAIWGATLLGAYVGTRRAYVAELAARAEHLEREREERAERAVVEERNRIARELHDVAAHHLSGIALQAAALDRTLPHDAQPARTMVDDIRTESATALTAMRRLIDVLRHDDTDGRAPQPTLGDLEDLAERAQADGIDVTIEDLARPARLPRDVDLAAYRIIQEALTNVRRHADGASTAITVRERDDLLDLEVIDDGTGNGNVAPGDVEPGHGLLGMRERAALLGGSLVAGPRRDGPGWRVRATLPIEEGGES
jgi:signal transduction histidine kinase